MLKCHLQDGGHFVWASVCKIGHVDGLVQDCSNSIANTLELLYSCLKMLSSLVFDTTILDWFLTQIYYTTYTLEDLIVLLNVISTVATEEIRCSVCILLDYWVSCILKLSFEQF